MSQITRTYSFTDGTTAYGSQVETEVQNIVTAWNNHDSASSSWTSLGVIGNGSVGGAFVVTGATTLSAALTVGTTLGVTGNTTLSGTLALTGAATLSGVLKLPDGSFAAPSLTFSGDTDTGIFRNGSDDFFLVAGGANTLRVNTSGLIMQNNLQIQGGAAGSASAPDFSFNSDSNTGMYRIGADNLGMSAGGTKVIDMTSTTVTIPVTLALSTALAAASGGTGTTTKLIRTGTYTGNGATQDIAHGMGTTPDCIIIADNTTNNNVPELWITGMSTTSHDFNGVRQTNAITAVGATNFSLGANNAVNQNTVTYSWIAIKAQ